MPQRSPAPAQEHSGAFTGLFFRTKEEDNEKNGKNGPPPQGTVIVEQVQTQSMRSSQPMAMVCPFCRQQMETEVMYESGMGAWLVAGLICLSGCCCFAWIPLVTDMMKDAIHVCSECHREVGRYIRLQPRPQKRVRTRRRPARDGRQPARETSQKSSSSWRTESNNSRKDSKNSDSFFSFGNNKQDSRQNSTNSFFSFGDSSKRDSKNSRNSRNDSKKESMFSWSEKRTQSERRPDGKRDLTERERRQRGQEKKRGSFSLW